MRKITILPLLFTVLFALIGCGKHAKLTDLAAEAMERARAAEADIYAPVEYEAAEVFYNQMNSELARGQENVANKTAEKVIEAANLATKVARQKKAEQKIKDLKTLLSMAKDMDIDVSNPDIYNQATQALIDAEDFYKNQDYEKAIEAAENGISLLETLVGGQEALALANLNRARELLDRAYRTTDLDKTRSILTSASNDIEISAKAYNKKDYPKSIKYSNSAIAKIEEALKKYPIGGEININVNQDGDNVQLQAYDLIRRLGKTIEYLKENNFTNDVHTRENNFAQKNDLTDDMDTKENDFTNDIYTKENMSSQKNTNKSQKSKPAKKLQPSRPVKTTPARSNVSENAVESQEEIDVIIFEDENGNETIEVIEIDGLEEDDEINIFMEDDDSVISYDFIKIDTSFKAQNMNQNLQQDLDSSELDVITLSMIEGYYNSAKESYDRGNYLNAVDLAREGLRLAELYLAGQTLTNHKVIRGDTLWDISGKIYKNRRYWLWPNIWRANKLQIKDPDLIYPGQNFRIPPAPHEIK